MRFEEYTEIERFLLLVEQFEVCADLIRSRVPSKCRMAIILLDNIAEVTLYNLCLEIFHNDDFSSLLKPKAIKISERKKILHYFGGKIKCVEDFYPTSNIGEPISSLTLTVIRILHSYRNLAYHRDTHNHRVLPFLSKNFFASVGDLFIKTQPSGSVGGERRLNCETLNKYGFTESMFDFRKNSKIIITKLLGGTKTNQIQLTKALSLDLNGRLERIDRALNTELPKGNVNELLKSYEYSASQKLNTELDNLNQKILEVKSKVILKKKGDSSELARLEDEHSKKVKEGFEHYSPKFRATSVGLLKERINKFSSLKSLESLMEDYKNLDLELTEFEDIVEIALLDWYQYEDSLFESWKEDYYLSKTDEESSTS